MENTKATEKKRLERFLAWSGKILKTDMAYLAGNSFWLIGGQICGSLFSFVMALVFARVLSKDVYGEYKYIISIMGILGAVSLSGLSTAVVYSVSRGYENSIRSGFWENIKWSALMTIAALGMAAYYGFGGNYDLAISMVCVAFITPLINSGNLYLAFLNGKKEFKLGTWYSLMGSGFSIAVMIIGGTLWPTVLGVMLSYFAGNVIASIVFYIITLKNQRPNTKNDPETLSYGKHLSLINVLTTVAGQFDNVLVFHFLGPIELAIYSFATSVPDQIKSLITNLDKLFIPRFAPREDDDILDGAIRKSIMLGIFGICIVGAYILAAPFFYKFFFPQYLSAVSYSQIYAVSLLNIVFTPWSLFLIAKKKIAKQYVSDITASVVQIVAMTVGLLWWGLWGLIIARVFVRFFGSGLDYILSVMVS